MLKMAGKPLFALFCLLFLGSAQAAKIEPVNFQGDPLSRVEKLLAQHKWDEAETLWRQLRGRVDAQLWHYNLGVILARRGKTAQAATQLERALTRREPEATIWQALKQLRTHEARAAYAMLFKSSGPQAPQLRWLPVSLQPQEVKQVMAAVRQRLQGWRNAWMAQDVAAYLSFYADDFRPVSGLSHAAWVAQRRERVSRPRFIDIQLSDVRIEPLTQTRVAVTFRQRYRSDRIRDTVVKRLVWENRGGRWVIVREVVL